LWCFSGGDKRPGELRSALVSITNEFRSSGESLVIEITAGKMPARRLLCSVSRVTSIRCRKQLSLEEVTWQ